MLAVVERDSGLQPEFRGLERRHTKIFSPDKEI